MSGPLSTRGAVSCLRARGFSIKQTPGSEACACLDPRPPGGPVLSSMNAARALPPLRPLTSSALRPRRLLRSVHPKLRLSPSPATPCTTQGKTKISQLPQANACACMRSRTPRSPHDSRRSVLPSTDLTVSVLRMSQNSTLIALPARSSTDVWPIPRTDARLEVKSRYSLSSAGFAPTARTRVSLAHQT